MIHHIFITKCQRARLLKSDGFNKINAFTSGKLTEEDSQDLLSFYDLANFELLKTDDERDISEVLKNMMSKTYSERVEQFKLLQEELAEAQKDDKIGDGHKSLSKKKKISK